MRETYTTCAGYMNSSSKHSNPSKHSKPSKLSLSNIIRGININNRVYVGKPGKPGKPKQPNTYN